MSIEATAWVLRQQVGDSIAKVVLWGIADHADRYGTNSYPSQETLADYAEVTRRTVVTKIGWLVKEGWLEVEHRSGRDGRKSNCYTILGLQSERASQPLSEKKPQLSETAASQEPSLEPGPSETTSPREEPAAPRALVFDDEGAIHEEPAPMAGFDPDPPSVQQLVAFYFDEAKRLSRFTIPSDAAHVAKQATDCLVAGASVNEVRGGIRLLLTKGLGISALASAIREFQAKRDPRPPPGPSTGSVDSGAPHTEPSPGWDEHLTESFQALDAEEGARLAREQLLRLNRLHGDEKTADPLWPRPSEASPTLESDDPDAPD